MNKYALLGAKLSHSYSKTIHEYFFDINDINATYDLIEVEESKLKEMIDKIRNQEYLGFNVTIPYKEVVIPYLDELTDAAKEIGAVNTIYMLDEKVIGDNTDYLGFIDELGYLDIEVKDKTVYVLGSGGASKAICYALEKLQANSIVVSRDSTKGITYEDLSKIDKIDLIINTTPVGMYPKCDGVALEKNIIEKAETCVDLIYNPKTTKFMEFAKKGYNGIYMLIYQALHAQYLWGNEIEFNVEELYQKL